MSTSLAATASIDWQVVFDFFLPYLIKGTGAIIVVLLSLVLAERMRAAVVGSLGHTRADPNTVVFVGRISHLASLAVGILVALGILGIDWAALLAIFGAVSLAVSLAIQDVLKNFVAGLYLLIERPFRVGETIKVRDFTGKVEDIGIRTTVLRTDDALQIVVPNAIIFVEVITNLSSSRTAAANADRTLGREAEAMPLAERESPGSLS